MNVLIVAVADAWACTNPSAGRGLTVGFLHARELRDTLRAQDDNPRSLVEEFDRRTETVVAPWYHAQIAMDRTRFAQMAAVREGREAPMPEGELAQQIASLFRFMSADPDLFRDALEYSRHDHAGAAHPRTPAGRCTASRRTRSDAGHASRADARPESGSTARVHDLGVDRSGGTDSALKPHDQTAFLLRYSGCPLSGRTVGARLRPKKTGSTTQKPNESSIVAVTTPRHAT